MSILMPTSVHIPKPLLAAVDKRARAMKVSRNRLIVQALERALAEDTDWSATFFDELASVTPDVAADVDELTRAIARGRRSKLPVAL